MFSVFLCCLIILLGAVSYSLCGTRIFLYLTLKSLVFKLFLLEWGGGGEPQSSYPDLIKLQILFLKLRGCLGYRILVLSNYDKGMDRWLPLQPLTFPKVNTLFVRICQIQGSVPCRFCSVFTLRDNVIRDNSGSGFVL